MEHGSVTAHYDHWAGCDLRAHLVLGPDHTVGWVRQQEVVDDHPDGGWLDELWASGGLTADLVRRRLVWFDLPADGEPRRRRVILAMLARTWPGWTVEYAARGLGDVAEAAGVSRGRVGDLGTDVCPNARVDLTAAVDPSEMPGALTEFFDEFTRAHAAEAVHPAIQAMDALESLLGLSAGVLNPAIADHHPLAATAEEVAAVVAHADELMMRYPAAEPDLANQRDLRPT